jgi:hypothetical protein
MHRAIAAKCGFVASVANLAVYVPVLFDAANHTVDLASTCEHGSTSANVSHIGKRGPLQPHELVDDLRASLESLDNGDARFPGSHPLELGLLAAHHRTKSQNRLVERHLKRLSEGDQRAEGFKYSRRCEFDLVLQPITTKLLAGAVDCLPAYAGKRSKRGRLNHSTNATSCAGSQTERPFLVGQAQRYRSPGLGR